jgi:hypothetical protein
VFPVEFGGVDSAARETKVIKTHIFFVVGSVFDLSIDVYK